MTEKRHRPTIVFKGDWNAAKSIITTTNFVDSEAISTTGKNPYEVSVSESGCDDQTIRMNGRLVHANGDVYEGEFLNNKANGYGEYKHADGSLYQGYWINNLQNGHGKETWEDGSVFEGKYLNG